MHNDEPFENREDAGKRLASKIKSAVLKPDFIIALPRGGVPLGKVIAEELKIPLKLCFIKKIGHPANEEFAIGAVSDHDEIISDKEKISEQYIKEKISNARARINEMKTKFGHLYSGAELMHKTIILVDDGIATGACLKLAAKEMRTHGVKQLVIATPVCPSNTVQAMKDISDHFICLMQPIHFVGIGGYYNDFKQLSDSEVSGLLS